MSTESPYGQMTPLEIEQLFRADPAIETGEKDISLGTIPANSPAMRQLLQELTAAADREPVGSPLQSLLRRITRGETDLRSALDDPSLPAPSADSLDEGTRTLIEELKEAEAQQ